MFRAKTVLVLGAGASVDLGLPMGSELLAAIRTLLDFRFEWNRPTSGDYAIFQALIQEFGEHHRQIELNEHLAAAKRICDASIQAMSIDNLVDALEDSPTTLMAKLAIVRAIHAAESKSLCARTLRNNDNRLDLSVYESHWYGSLSKLLFEQVRISNVEIIFNNLEIINFNYDRCLEAYLPHSIANYYGMPLDLARALVGRLPVHRPYGQAGDLATVKFGGGRNPAELMKVASGIRTFTEQVNDENELQAIRACLSSADRIVFLGFAFHRQNLHLLETTIQDHTEVLATAYGVSQNDQSVISDEISKAFGMEPTGSTGDLPHPTLSLPGVFLYPVKCSEFFNDNWRTLTADAPEI